MNTVRPSTRAFAVAFAVAGVLGAAAAPATADPAQRSGQVECRGEGVDAKALIRYRTDVVINAPLSTVWNLQTDVERWPSWQPPVKTLERLEPGPLRRGSSFRWTTPAPPTPTTPETTLTITSKVGQIRNQVCVLWRGPAVGDGLSIDEGVHVWTFTEVEGGVRVRTEETWTGDQVEADVPTATRYLGWGLEEWLTNFKTTAEAC